MSDSETEQTRNRAIFLKSSNYNTWAYYVEGELMKVGALRIILGTLIMPTPTPTTAAVAAVAATGTAAAVPAVPAVYSAADRSQIEKFIVLEEKAAGIIRTSLSTSQLVHIQAVRTDALGMWNALKAVHQAQKANTRFFALQKLLGVTKSEGESLTDFIGRAGTAANDLSALIPATLTVADVVKELLVHAAITGLGAGDYDNFVSSVLMIDNLDQPKLSEAFRNEDMRRQTSSSSTASMALAARARIAQANAANSGTNRYVCTHPPCGKTGHTIDRCWELHPELKTNQRSTRGGKGKGKANKAKEENAEPMESACNTLALHRI